MKLNAADPAVSVPSLSTSSVSDPSTMWLNGEAGNWDLLWGVYGDAFGYCGGWGTWTAIPNYWDLAGPHARKRTVDGRSGFNAGCMWANGFTTYTSADGSAKAFSYRGYIVNKTVDLGGGVYGLRVFWPNYRITDETMQFKTLKLVILPALAASIVFGLAAGCGTGEDSAAKKEAMKPSPKGSAKATAEPTGTAVAK